uniref:Uncharacterized protein n=1 Tax=Zooxanthella nutricula TaxID=1333877 RepID=A0A6V0A2Z8_9DINO|mmetsp:Transcript_80821/g.246978  ORF Transcript_80821/g.246978 Transcript_80821/m.246978 type:complete len:175 (+) Transcript_80821:318-842(+)
MPSACQLQRVGDLSEGGRAEIDALAHTIIFGVDSSVPPATEAYSLEVLTVATQMSGQGSLPVPAAVACEAGGQRGTAGHVMLTFRSGGMLLASAGHWSELVKIDATEELVLRTAEEQYGEAYASRWAAQLRSAPDGTRPVMTQSFAAQIVQQSPVGSFVASAQSAPPAPGYSLC